MPRGGGTMHVGPLCVARSRVPFSRPCSALRYLRDVKGALQLRSLATGALREEVQLPGVGSLTSVTGVKEGPCDRRDRCAAAV